MTEESWQPLISEPEVESSWSTGAGPGPGLAPGTSSCLAPGSPGGGEASAACEPGAPIGPA